MTRSELLTKRLQTEAALRVARARVKEAQALYRVTGHPLPFSEYNALWSEVHELKRVLETTHLRLATVEAAEAERFVEAAKNLLQPETLERIAREMSGGAQQ